MAPAHFLDISGIRELLKILAPALVVIDLIDIYCREALLQSPNNRIDGGEMLIIYTTTTIPALVGVDVAKPDSASLSVGAERGFHGERKRRESGFFCKGNNIFTVFVSGSCWLCVCLELVCCSCYQTR